jgi:ABC-type nitrate/sulfonate/bicarbonate transport system permease component
MFSFKKWVLKLLPFLYAVTVIIIIWQLVIIFNKPHPSILPTPWATAKNFWQLVENGLLWMHTMASLSRVISAWLLSAFIAIPLGLLMGRSILLEKLIDPFIELFRPISPLAWIPLAILWFGIGEGGKIFVVFIGTFFPILLSTIAGVKSIDPVLIHAGRVLGCQSRFSLFYRVILPASMPGIMVGLRISFGTGWAAIIAAELVAARSGLGYLIANGMEILRADHVLVGMIMIGLLGVCFDAVFRFINRRVTWKI